MFTVKSISRIFSALMVFALILALTLSALGTTPARAAGMRFVTPTGAGDCASWGTTCDLQTALTGAISGDEIWVAAGTYQPTSGADRAATFTLKAGVAIYGGFAGSESAREQRDPTANLTVLSGDIDHNDSQTPVITDLTTVTGNSSNSYHVVTCAADATLDGFTITAGNIYTDYGGAYGKGAGMTNSGNPTLLNVTFSGNNGGGMYNGGQISAKVRLALTNVTFNNNSAGSGGGIYNAYTWGTITNATFSNNSATDGGGMYNADSHPTLINTTFSGNSSSGNGGGMYNEYSYPLLINTTFSGNSTSGNGGGVYNASGGNPDVRNATFSGNSAGQAGGAMYTDNGSPQISNSILWGNIAPTGAQISSDGSTTPELTQSVVQGGCPNFSTCTNVITTDPKLGLLGNYGGFSQTIPLGANSSAIDAGNNATCEDADQRGYARPVDGDGNGSAICDLGAYEAGASVLAPTHTPTITPTNTLTPTLTPTLRATGIRYVTPGGVGNCSSWGTACDLQTALTGAISGDEIWVAAGTYLPTSGADRTATFALKNGVAVYGGFAGNESARGQRNPATHVTILSGDLSGNDNSNIQSNEPTRADNSYHVVSGADATLDGFTITAGNANGSYPKNVGGGIFDYSASPILSDVTFSGNSASDRGGGMYNEYVSNPTLTNVTFSGNTASNYGGGMDNDDSVPTLTNVTFSGNSAAKGGGISNTNGSLSTATNATFNGNSASIYGGGISNEGDSVSLSSNTIFWGNTAPNGAQVYFKDINNDPSWAHLHNDVVQNGCPHGSWLIADCTKVITTDPKLGALGNYGGSSQTIPLLAGSSALDAGDSATCAATDQRGYARPADGDGNGSAICDIGAYEVAAGVMPTPTINLTPATQTLTPTFTQPVRTSTPTLTPTKTLTPSLTPTLHTPGIRYVTSGGLGNCSSWGAACALQTALMNAVSGDEIWVAAGTYQPTSNGTDREATFTLNDGVAVYGGFAGNETARAQRNPATHLTILSGDIDHNDSQTPIITDLATVTGNSSNSYHVVTCGATNATLDGFTITAGSMLTDGWWGSAGGMDNSGNPTLTNLTFRGNTANLGGAMYNTGNPALTNVTFNNNSARNEGGGIYNEGDPTLTNVTFNNNSASNEGGGIYNEGNPILTNVTFNNNSAYVGGGISDDGTPTLTDVTFSNNSADMDGGGMSSYGSPALINVTFSGNTSSYGGGMYSSNASSPTLTKVTFNGNSATDGGGMYSYVGNLTLTDVIFSNNSSTTRGGGLNTLGSSMTLTNVTFYKNTATSGGGIYNEDSNPVLTNATFSGNAAASGGGMYNDNHSNPVLTNVTFSNNSASQTGGAINNDAMASVPQISNTIFWGNTAPYGAQIYDNVDNSSYSVLSNSVAQGGCPAGSTCTNIISADPKLGALGNYGGFSQTIPLLAGSSAIDAGNNTTCATTDQRGYARPKDGDGNGSAICDIGAYEAGYALPLTRTPTPTINLTPATKTFTPTLTRTKTLTPTKTLTRTFTPTLRTLRMRYVKPGGLGNCSSWLTACNLQTALTSALSGDEIWVAAGTYQPTSNGLDRAATFTLKNGVAVYGGFAGNERARAQRNPATHVTILSGDIDHDDSQKPIITNLATVNGNSTNSYHVVTCAAHATLDGFTITAGNSVPADYGGGMYNSGSPALTNLTFRGNTANFGGAMYNVGNPTLTNVTFSNNSANNEGGGMYNKGNPTLTNVTFNNNHSSDIGGGIANSGSPTLTNVTFSNNSADMGGGGMASSVGSPALANVIFSGNTSSYGGGMYNSYTSRLTLTKVTFNGNSASLGGGGMYDFGDSSTLTDVTFSHNSAVAEGGGLYSVNTMTLTNVTFYKNTATSGGGIFSNDSILTLTNVTFSGNAAVSGGGMYNYNGSNAVLKNATFSNNSASQTGGAINNDMNSLPQISNTIIWSNTALYGAQIYDNVENSSYSVLSNSVAQGGCPAGSICTNIISANPKLGALGDYGGFSQTILLLAGSSAIDAGNNTTCATTDQRGYARPKDGDGNGSAICDIGAYEAGYALPPTRTPTRTPTKTFTPTVAKTITRTVTRTPTRTLTRTPTRTLAKTRTKTPARTPTRTPTRVIKVITFVSTGAYDGWVLESTQYSNKGAKLNYAAATLYLGDNAQKKQYRGILSFNTGGLPDNAVITAVMLKVRQQAILGGGNPVTLFGGFMADVKTGFFGTAPVLQAGDFQAAAAKSYGPFVLAPTGGWYNINLSGTGSYVNKLATASGLTQFRLRFKLDDNNNAVANVLSLYSGNTASAANRPQLVITYYIP